MPLIVLLDIHIAQVCMFINRVALAKQGDNALGSIRLSVYLFVCLSVCPSSPALTVCPNTSIFIDREAGR